MEITEFFQQSAGKWFAHRTNQQLGSSQSEISKSDVWVDFLSQDAPEVSQLCVTYEVDPVRALCGMKVRWSAVPDSTYSRKTSSQTHTVMLVPVINLEQPNRGQLLRSGSAAAPTLGEYVWGTDEALTLIVQAEGFYSEERIWFVSPNLRLRSTMVQQANGSSMTSFCSEIRMVMTPPTSDVASAATQA